MCMWCAHTHVCVCMCILKPAQKLTSIQHSSICQARCLSMLLHLISMVFTVTFENRNSNPHLIKNHRYSESGLHVSHARAYDL